jgi:aspartyl-tRNA(Asn)/glutamyl-tRNA(Gln) amidotransferase subunit A
VIRHFYARDMEADPEMTAGIDAAAAKLGELGAEVREITTDPLADWLACNRTILTSEAFAIHEKWMRERPQDYGARARERLMAGAFVRAADYINATRMRRRMTDAFHALFAEIDVAITPARWTRRAVSTTTPRSSSPTAGRRARRST